jgi:hypothetical protein
MIRFSQVSSLNDSTEFTPLVVGVGRTESIIKIVRDRFEQKFPGLIAAYRNLYPDSVVEKMLDDLAKKGAAEIEANFERTKTQMFQKLDLNFGVLSLSEDPLQKLLWSYYGDGERGHLIEFDATNSWFSQKREERDGFRHLRPVRYVVSREPKYIFDLTDDDVLYTKDHEFAWEKEWRIILNFNSAATKAAPDAYGNDVLLFAVPPGCITGVVIGLRADAGFTASLKATVRCKRRSKNRPRHAAKAV